MRTIELGVTITDAAGDEKVTTIFCAPVARDPRCPDCGREGRYRDTVTRALTDLPLAGYPLVLQIAVPRAATPSDSETSPTTAGAHCYTAAHSTHSSTHSELRRAG
jgi:hypothetical protein